MPFSQCIHIYSIVGARGSEGGQGGARGSEGGQGGVRVSYTRF